MEQERICKNCKFFKMHYVYVGTSFQRLGRGHCMNDEISWKVRKHNMSSDYCCDRWESNEDKKEDRKERIETVLKSMRTTLIHIENILKEDLNTD